MVDGAVMDERRAAEINQDIVTCWMIREGLSSAPIPDLRRVSLAEAIEASNIVLSWPTMPDPDKPGWRILTCTVDVSRIPRLYAWAILKKENGNG